MKPRIRSLKPEMWADEKVVALSRDARLLLLGMVTMADDEGRFRARRSQLVGHVFPNDDDAHGSIDQWVAEIKEQGIVVFYISGDTPYGAFRNWRKHQKINRPSPSDLPPPPHPKIVRQNKVKAHGANSDNAQSVHGVLSELTGMDHSPTRRRAFRSDPDQIRSLLQNGSELTDAQRVALLCALLAAHICRNDPKAEPNPDDAGWRRDMRLLLASRNGDVDEVIHIIDWCQADSFWRSNVLCPAKLRKQFTQLVLKANGQQNGHRQPSDLDARRLAAMQRLMNHQNQEEGAA